MYHNHLVPGDIRDINHQMSKVSLKRSTCPLHDDESARFAKRNIPPHVRTPVTPGISVFRPTRSVDLDELMVSELTYQTQRTAKRQKHGSIDDRILFTAKQVERIVRDALNTREEQLRDEYDQILHNLLQEQFENSSRFNQDCVRRAGLQSHHTEEYIS